MDQPTTTADDDGAQRQSDLWGMSQQTWNQVPIQKQNTTIWLVVKLKA